MCVLFGCDHTKLSSQIRIAGKIDFSPVLRYVSSLFHTPKVDGKNQNFLPYMS